MAAPSFTTVNFPNDGKANALHKTNHNTPDQATFSGCKGVTKGDGVTVIGTKGKKTTIWDGTIDSVSSSGKDATSVDLTVIRVAKNRRRRKKAPKRRKAGRGTEDVSTTISNGDPSPPVSQKVEPLP
jgi:hypothetical protein